MNRGHDIHFVGYAFSASIKFSGDRDWKSEHMEKRSAVKPIRESAAGRLEVCGKRKK